MKFTLFTQAILALPLATGALATPVEDFSPASDIHARAKCDLTIKYIKSWVESGLDRYRMQLIANPREDRLNKLYCDKWRSMKGLVSNKQCGWNNGAYYVDGSVVRGSAGHRAIRDSHFSARNEFQYLSGCTTQTKF